MKRFLNFRPFLFVFVSFMGGVFSYISLILQNILPIIFCGLIFIVSLVLLIIDLAKKDCFKKFSNICGAKRLLWPCFCVVMGFLVGISASAISFAVKNKRPFEDGKYNCTAQIAEVTNYANTQAVLLKNVIVDGEVCDFKLKLTLSTEYLKVGDNLTFAVNLFASNLVQNGSINTNILKNNIKYYGYVDMETLIVTDGKAGVLDVIKDATKNILLDNMSEQNAGFAYATIVGDKSLLSDVYYNVFKNAGLAHILAVSGLHVGFLVGVVIFLLNLFKIRKKYQFFIVAGVLFIYCILCGFSPSIFRASVMSLCLMLGMILGEQNDTVSNLCLAGLIVLLSQPLYLYDVGFLLSFGSVFGILLLSKQISKLISKTKLPQKLCDLLAVTISATLGTVPAVFAYFGEISLISLLSNLVVLPLFSIMFVVLLVCVVVNLILPLSFLISFAEFFINIVVSLSSVFAQVEMINTITFDVITSIIYYALLFLISRFFMLKAKNKAIITLSVILATSPYLGYINIPTIFSYSFVATTSAVEKSLFIATKNNQKVLINVGSDDYDVTSTKNMLKQYKVYTLDYLLLFDYKDSHQKTVVEFANNFDIKNIVAFGKLQSSTKVGLATKLKYNNVLSFCSEDNFSTKNNQISINVLYVNDIFKATNITFDSVKILKIENSLSENQITSNSKFFGDYDYCFAKNYNKAMKSISCSKFITCYSNETFENLKVLDDNTVWSYRFST